MCNEVCFAVLYCFEQQNGILYTLQNQINMMNRTVFVLSVQATDLKRKLIPWSIQLRFDDVM